MRLLTPCLVLAACSGGEEAAPPPTLEILAPADGASVTAGEVAVSVVVTDFVLVEPGTQARRFDPTGWLPLSSAYAHGDEAAARGWLALTLDDVEVGTLGDTQGALTDVLVGSHVLSVELIHEDGDPVEPAVRATTTFVAE